MLPGTAAAHCHYQGLRHLQQGYAGFMPLPLLQRGMEKIPPRPPFLKGGMGRCAEARPLCLKSAEQYWGEGWGDGVGALVHPEPLARS